MAGQLKINGVTLATEDSSVITLENPQIKDSSNNLVLDQSGSKAVLKNVEVVNDSPLMFRNRIINGDMRIDQRNAGALFSNTTNSTKFAADRFKIGVTASNPYQFDIQRVLDAPSNSGLIYSNKVTVNTASSSLAALTTDTFQMGQHIEYGNIYDLNFNDSVNKYYVSTYTINNADTWEKKVITVNSPVSGGKTITISFWVKSSIGSNSVFSFGLVSYSSKVINSYGIYVVFDLGQGSSYRTSTLNTWGTDLKLSYENGVRFVENQNATWQITGVQLEVGNQATPFEHRPYGVELGLCERYYQQYLGYVRTGMLRPDGYRFAEIYFRTAMRAAPTVSSTYNDDGTGTVQGSSTIYNTHLYLQSGAATSQANANPTFTDVKLTSEL